MKILIKVSVLAILLANVLIMTSAQQTENEETANKAVVETNTKIDPSSQEYDHHKKEQKDHTDEETTTKKNFMSRFRFGHGDQEIKKIKFRKLKHTTIASEIHKKANKDKSHHRNEVKMEQNLE